MGGTAWISRKIRKRRLLRWATVKLSTQKPELWTNLFVNGFVDERRTFVLFRYLPLTAEVRGTLVLQVLGHDALCSIMGKI